MKHLKSIKAVFLNEFPIHKLWKYELFFKRETRRFSDMCDRKRVIHPSEQEVERKSIPLSRKLESSRDLIRAKNLNGVNKVDLYFNRMTISLVDQGDAVACRGLGVVNCIYQAVARRSELHRCANRIRSCLRRTKS
mmetsp:Transcript_16795/g.37680  ORF Transcript_16795/g.37680 Transcript_16795/m.37680 type:complete len:136 (-) Transcript_16795:374-781(-)